MAELEARVSSGNGRNMSGEFPLWLKYGDVEMMYDVMQYGITRMILGGEKNSKEAVERFRELFEQIKAMSPLPEDGRNRGNSAFFDALRAVETCDSFEVVVEKVDRSLDEAVIAVLVHENAETSRFDLTRWLKIPKDAGGRKDQRQVEEIFEEYVERIGAMLVETSPVHAVRIVEYSAPLLVASDDWSFGDELKVTLQSLCEETFGPTAEFRSYRWKGREDEHLGFIDIDVVFAAPCGLGERFQELASERSDDILQQVAAAHLRSV
jgi:hypothetical protein